MNKYIELFEECLHQDGWHFERKESELRTYLMAGFKGENCRLDIAFDAEVDKDVVMCVTYLPVIIPKQHYSALAELICRLNYYFSTGCFQLDFDDDIIRFKAAIDIAGGELTLPMIRNLRDTTLCMADRYYPFFMRLFYGDKSPVQICQEIDDYKEKALAAINETEEKVPSNVVCH